MSRRQFSFLLCICVNLVGMPYSARVQKPDKTYINSSFSPAYAVASDAEALNSTCGKELQDFRNAVDHGILWSWKMLDFSGTPKPSSGYGNDFWLGIPYLCQNKMNLTPLPLTEKEKYALVLFNIVQAISMTQVYRILLRK